MNEKTIPPGLPDPEEELNQPITLTPELEAAARLLIKAGQEVEVPAAFAGRLEKELSGQPVQPVKEPYVGGFVLFGRPLSRLGMMLAGALTMTLILLLVLPLLLPVLLPPAKPATATPAQQTALNPAAPQSTPDPASSTNGVPNASPSLVAPIQLPGAQLMLSFFGSLASAQSNPGGLFGKAQLTLSGSLPANLQEMPVYEQRSGEQMTAELAKQAAARLGIQGEVYTAPSEAQGETIYHVTDGKQEVWFMQGTTHFTYVADIQNSMINRPSTLPLAERAKAAEAFLKQHGLLDFEYRLDETLSQGSRVVFDRLLNGAPLLETDSYNPHISAEVDGDGKVALVFYGLNSMPALGNYPIRSAQDAWRIVLGDPNDKRVQYSVSDPLTAQPAQQPSWTRSYKDGARVDMTFYLNVLPAAQPGAQPWVSLNGFTLLGDLNGLITANSGEQELSPQQKQMIASGEVSDKQAIGWSRFFHVWGALITENNGARVLRLDGWERSLMPDDTFFGDFIEQNGTRLFISEDGKKWTLQDVPADVPLNERMSVRGVRVQDQPGLFNWSEMQVEPPAEATTSGGGGGGGGGGFDFSPNPGAAPTEVVITPAPLPYQNGQKLEGVTGILHNVNKQVDSNGNSVMHYNLELPMPDNPQDGRSVELTGAGAQGLEALIKLHVKVWGAFQIVNGSATLQVERYEKAYPDEKVQAWLGHEKVDTLNGRKVLLFTDSTGKQYVLSMSLMMPEQFVEDGFRGEQFIVEGLLSQETYAGYPIITEFEESIAPGRTDLSGYQLHSTQVLVESGYPAETPAPPLQQSSVTSVVIDKVELAYFAYDFSHGGGSDLDTSPARFVQPVWRFSGKLNDGRSVEVLVQAVVDAYLK